MIDLYANFIQRILPRELMLYKGNKKNLLEFRQQVFSIQNNYGCIITFIAFSLPAFPNTSYAFIISANLK